MKRTLVPPTILFVAAAIAGFGDMKDILNPTDRDNVPAPPGAILDLPAPIDFGVWTQYSVNFTATSAMTDLMFLFRNDSGWTLLDDVSVMDITHPSGNLLTNPGFETGSLTGWTYDNVNGGTFDWSGQNGTRCQGFASVAHSGNYSWCDGAPRAYDGIDQKFATNIGDLYTINFYQNVDDITEFSPAKYQQASPNSCTIDSPCGPLTGGNAPVDTLVYVGTAILAVPEPFAMILLGSCVLGLVPVLRRRIR